MKSKVKTFLHVFWKSLLPQSEYYQKILTTKFRFSLRYFLTLIIIINIVFIVHLFFRFNPKRIINLTDNIINTLNNIPDDLTIIINKGTLMTTYNRPYLFWLNDQEKTKLLLVIDQNATPEMIRQYQSYLLVTAKEIVINPDKIKQKTQSIPLNYTINQTIDKKSFTAVSKSLSRIKALLPFFYFVFFIIMVALTPLFSSLVTLLYLAIACLITYVIFHFFMQKRIHAKKIIQISFHAVTLPLLVDYFFIMFQRLVTTGIVSLPNIKPIPFPYLFIALLTVFVFGGTYEAYLDSK